MGPRKQKYIPQDLSKRFQLLSVISLIFLGLSAISLLVGAFKVSFINAGINLFALASAIATYRTAKSSKPQMSVYYFSIGFLVFIVGNTIFWVNHFLNNDFQTGLMGLMLLSFLLILNLIILYAVTYKSYQLLIHTVLSLAALLIYNILELGNLKITSIEDILIANIFPIFFLVVTSALLIIMYQVRIRINEHYKAKYKSEKKHLLKITGNLDYGYVSFRLKYNKNRQPVNAKIDHYNQKFRDIWDLSQISIDNIKISELSKNGKLIFENYLDILEEFNNKKSFRLDNHEINGEKFKTFVFSIENDQMGMMIKKP